MRHRPSAITIAVLCSVCLVAASCGRSDNKSSSGKKGTSGAPASAPGFDGKTITLGVLTPESGIAKVIGDPLTNGNKVFFDNLNANGGVAGKYKVKLNIRDNKYTEADTTTQYGQIKDSVTAFLQVLGTAPTQAIIPNLNDDNILASPASLDAPWLKEKQLVPILNPYQIQAINSISYYVDNLGGKGKKICALTSDDPYGNAGEEGAKFGAQQKNVELTDSVKFSVGAPDFSSQVDELKSKGCEMVWLTALPTDAGGILGRAAQTNFTPQWIGQSPTWVSIIAQGALGDYMKAHFLLASEGVEWGNTSVPGMKTLLAAKDKFAPDQKPDIYFVFGWLQGMAMNQILENAVKDGDLSRAGLVKALDETKKLSFDGLVNDEPYGAPADRNPSRATTLFKVDPATIPTNGGLTTLKENFVTDAAKKYKFGG